MSRPPERLHDLLRQGDEGIRRLSGMLTFESMDALAKALGPAKGAILLARLVDHVHGMPPGTWKLVQSVRPGNRTAGVPASWDVTVAGMCARWAERHQCEIWTDADPMSVTFYAHRDGVHASASVSVHQIMADRARGTFGGGGLLIIETLRHLIINLNRSWLESLDVHDPHYTARRLFDAPENLTRFRDTAQ